jgi:hypothetical protein
LTSGEGSPSGGPGGPIALTTQQSRLTGIPSLGFARVLACGDPNR